MKSKDDKSFKAPSRVGKVDKTIEVFTRLQADREAELTSEEDSWMVQCALCFCNPVILPLLLACEDEPESAATEESILDRTHIVSLAPREPLKSANCLTFIDNPSLIKAAKLRLVGCCIDTQHRKFLTENAMALVKKVYERHINFKLYHLPDSTELRFHWSILCYEENLVTCCELVAMMSQINKNVEAVKFEGSLLCPAGTGSA